MISSCDSKEDAIASLSRIYDVSCNSVQSVIGSDWPTFVDDGAFQDSQYFGFLVLQMGQALSSTVQGPEVNEAAYYHRTRFDGTQTWFDEGLVDAENGARKILNHVKKHMTDSEYADALSYSVGNIRCRELNSNDNGQPCAFDVFEDAFAATRPGMDYSVPEFLVGDCWPPEIRNKVTTIIRRELQPVIVKFKARTTGSDDYIATLWHYLYRLDCNLESPPLRFTRANELVRHSDILELMRVQESDASA